MAWLNRTTIHVMVSVLAGITIQRPDGVVWDLAIAGNVASGFHLLAPACKLYRSWRAGTLAQQRKIYSYGLDYWTCLMWICFSVLYLPLPNAKFVIIVNSVGAAAQTAFAILCIWYSSWTDHKGAIGVFVIATLSSVAVLCLILTKTIAHQMAIQIVGSLAITIGLLSTLCTTVHLVMMIKAKNLSGLDTFSVVFALPSGCLWISYGAKLSPLNIFVLVPNAASLAIAVAQIIAFIVFKIVVPPPGPVLPILVQPPAPVLPEIELSQMAPVAAGAVLPSVMHADADDLGDTLRGMFQGEV